MNSEGKGRLSVNSKTYIFTYFSALDSEESKWVLGLNFPFQDEETFELDWSRNSKMNFKTSIDTKILKENTNIDPAQLDLFISSLGESLKDIIKLKSRSKSNLTYKWMVDKNSLFGESRSKKTSVKFTNVNNEGFFGLIDFSYNKKENQSFRIEFILKECFEQRLNTEKA